MVKIHVRPENIKATQRHLSISLLFHFLRLVGYPYNIQDPLLQHGANSDSAKKRAESRCGNETRCTKRKTCSTNSMSRPEPGQKELDQEGVVKVCSVLRSKRCQEMLTNVGMNVLFLVISALFVANLWRYVVRVVNITKLDSDAVAMIIFLLQWGWHYYLFFLGKLFARSKLTKFVAALREYELQFGYSFDVAALNSWLKTAIIVLHVGTNCIAVMFYWISCFTMKAFRTQLTPFQDAEGMELIGILMLASVLFNLCISGHYTLLFPLTVMSSVIWKDFLFISGKMSELLPRKGKEITCPSKETSREDKADLNRSRERGPEVIHFSPSGKTTSDFKPAGTMETFGDLEPPAATETTISDLEPPETLTTRISQSQTLIEVKKLALYLDSPSTVMEATSTDLELETPVSKETAFDLLCNRHAALCHLVEHVQSFSQHYYPAVYGFSMISYCLVIFAWARGSLPLANLVGVACVLNSNVMASVFYTYIGVRVQEAAKSLLQPIHASDKTSLPVSLLVKMQMVVQRLTTEEVGYHVYGLFYISRSTVLMLVGTILTYTTVVVQFQMGDAAVGNGSPTTEIPSFNTTNSTTAPTVN